MPAISSIIYESTIADDIFDILLKNTQYEVMDFCATFDNVYVDRSKACIYLSDSNNLKNKFKIKIERV